MNITKPLISQTKKPVTLLALFSFFCLGLVSLRYIRTHNHTYFFLIWNLFLAWVPLLFAMIWQHRLGQKKRLAKWKSAGMFGLWLLFFPNAPYIITDLVHLNNRFNPAMWLDMLTLFSLAFGGLIVGLYSLRMVHKLLDHFFTKSVSWIIISVSLLLTGFGVYLGRIQRWNSWDLFTNPIHLISDIFFQLSDPLAIKMTLGFSVLLGLIYLTLISISHYERNTK